MESRYCILFSSGNEKELKDYKDTIRLMENPNLYTCDALELTKKYSLLMDGVFPQIDDKDFTTLQDYDILFTSIIKLVTQYDSFVNDSSFASYNIKGVDNHLEDDCYISFIYNNIKYYIATNHTAYKSIFPYTNNYLVVYDESQDVIDEEMLPLMTKLCNNLGKNNIYTAVKRWSYIDTNNASIIGANFYIFYSGKEPSNIICKEVVRKYLYDTFGKEESEKRFPELFITDVRRIFCLFDIDKYTIDVNYLNNFIKSNNVINNPEIIYILDNITPLLVENGVTDVIENFYPFSTSTSTVNNNFLFYVSKVLNYFEGKISKEKLETYGSIIIENEKYVSVNVANIEWQIMKKEYTDTNFVLNQ